MPAVAWGIHHIMVYISGVTCFVFYIQFVITLLLAFVSQENSCVPAFWHCLSDSTCF